MTYIKYPQYQSGKINSQPLSANTMQPYFGLKSIYYLGSYQLIFSHNIVGIVYSTLCNFCQPTPETVEHIFVNCHLVKKNWIALNKWTIYISLIYKQNLINIITFLVSMRTGVMCEYPLLPNVIKTTIFPLAYIFVVLATNQK